jgi:hypothetical protein
MGLLELSRLCSNQNLGGYGHVKSLNAEDGAAD